MVDAAIAAFPGLGGGSCSSSAGDAAGDVDFSTESLYEAHVRRAKAQLAEQSEARNMQRHAEAAQLRAKHPLAVEPAPLSLPPRQVERQVEFTSQVEVEQQRRRVVKQLRQQAAVHIQACYRRHTVRRTLRALNHLSTIIQKNARGRASRRYVAELLAAGLLPGAAANLPRAQRR